MKFKALSEVRWGIIGCGGVTEVKSGPALQKVPGSGVAAVMRRDGAKAADYARRHNVARSYDNADKLLKDPEVNAIYIATPPGTHQHYALKAAEIGKPAYVEKPMARSGAECDGMVAAFESAALPLFVAYYRRALPRFVKAREIVDSGRLGSITGVNIRYAGAHHRPVDPANLPWRVSAAEAGGGLLLDLGSHTLDIVDFLVGPLSKVSGHAANVASASDVEDAVVMQFATPGGAPGVGHWNFASPVREDLIEITGTDAMLSISTFSEAPVKVSDGVREELYPFSNPLHIQQPLIETVVAALLGRGECPSTGQSAARTSKVMDAALWTYYGARDDEFWARPTETWPGRRR